MRRRNRKVHKASSNPFIEASKRTGGRSISSNRRRRRHPDIKKLRSKAVWIAETVAAVLLAFIVVQGMGTRVTVVGESMEPTLSDGDCVLINRISLLFFPASEGSLIAFLPRGNQDSSVNIKRVIAGPGESVRIENGAIYVNGQIYEEGTVTDYIEDAGLAEDEIVLGNDEYFCLGDNRNNSQDSRYESVGNVRRSDIIGIAWFEVAGSSFGLLQ